MPESVSRRSAAATGASYAGVLPWQRRGGVRAVRRGVLEDAAGALDRLERDAPAGVDVRADRIARGVQVAELECIDDRCVLGGEVGTALEAPAADHLHHQVHRQLAVEAR